jgi:ADP-ribose pyrophosphatase YjhB (NUDIX family)
MTDDQSDVRANDWPAVRANEWPDVREQVERRTDRVVSDLQDEWESAQTVESFEYGPVSHAPDEPPETVAEQLEHIAGIASVVTFYTPDHEETVLVYNPAGFWEPPGGVIERDQTPAEAARAEAHEETGLDVELTDLLYAGRFDYRYESGETVPLPVAQFVGHHVSGSLHVEREGTDHPGVTRATGLFDAEVFPEECRDAEEIRRLLGE